MSNEETLQEYNNNLAGNNEALRGVLNMIDELSDADLTGYATIEYVDEAIANNVPEIDLTEYATTEYVDDENKGLVILNNFNLGRSPGNGYGIVDETTLNKILNGILKERNYPPAILANNGSRSILFTLNSTSTSNDYKTFNYRGLHLLAEKTNTYEIHTLTFRINGMGYRDSDTKTISNVSTSFSHINRSLNTDNTISYTPTADYNPATKKYVDDAVAAVNSSSSESLLDIYSIEEVKTNKVWIDGKPIYRRVVIVDDIGVSPNMTISYDFDISTVDRIWIDETAAFAANDYESFALSSYYEGDVWIKAWVNKNVGLRLRCSIDLPGYSAYITLNYTKTTDIGTEVE